MKKTFLLTMTLAVISCQKEKVEATPQFNDSLIVVENNEINKLIRSYDNYEKNFVKAIQKNDIGEIKKYSDSANFYDKKLFDEITMGKLSDDEKNKFSEQINNIRKEKMEALSTK